MKRYRIISELGKGAMGVVFKAVRSDDGSTVALKKLMLPGHLDAQEEEGFINRFKTEAKAALALKHPGIVRALDCGLDEGTFYIAYELIEGDTLEEAIGAKRVFSPEEVTDIIAQAAEALDYAHNEGVVHRDLSPGNIFITGEGKVKIADFGVAGFTKETTVTPDQQAIVGTPGYMAPEQVTGGEADPRNDIFSFGCVAYELLTLEKAFKGDNIAQIIHGVINKQPVAVRQLNPKVPLALEELVTRLLAKKRDYRYQSMEEVRSAAMRVLEEIPRSPKKDKGGEAGHAPMLVVIEGPYEGKEFKLQPTVTTIGRAVGDILLPDDGKVEPQHAWITREGATWVLYDADTEGGTFLNGESIEREEILPGDTVRIGDSLLEFRGAGGHIGAFQEASVVPEAGREGAVTGVVKKKRLPLAMAAMVILPVLAVITILVIIGVILPGKYIADLDKATNDRWDEAFEGLAEKIIGTVEWTGEAELILEQWEDDPVINAPSWVIGRKRINAEIDYRIRLSGLAREFLIAVTKSWGSGTEGAEANRAYQEVGELKRKVEGLEAPDGVDEKWIARQSQLSGIIIDWMAATDAGPGTEQAGAGSQAERVQAQGELLTGYNFLKGATQRNQLDNAFNAFISCVQITDAIITTKPDDGQAFIIRGLAHLLMAKAKKAAGDILGPVNYDGGVGPNRYEQAIEYLHKAGNDFQLVNSDDWVIVINEEYPQDFRSEYPSLQSVLSELPSLELELQNKLDEQYNQ